MLSTLRSRTLVPVLAFILVVGLLGSSAGLALSAPSAAPALASAGVAKLVIKPGHEAAVPVSSAFRNGSVGVTFQIPDEFDKDLSVGLVLRSGSSASSGYRISVRLGRDGAVTESISRVVKGRSTTVVSRALGTSWRTGDLIHVEGQVRGAGKVSLKMRAWADAEAVPAWQATGKDSSRSRISSKGRALAWGALTVAASSAVTVGVLPLSATSFETLTSDPVDPAVPVPSDPAEPAASQEPSDSFGPIGHLPSAGSLAGLGWAAAQAPQNDSITVLGPHVALGTDRPAGSLLRAKLEPDETYTDGRCRAEVYGRRPTPWSTPAARWPDPVGSERWYTLRVYFPASFPLRSDATWLDFTQWKGYHGGTPPIALEIKRSNLRLGGDRGNRGLIPNAGNLGPIALGHWTKITVGMHLSTSSTDGWVEAYRDGTLVVPRTPMATMDTYEGAPDPIYLKQGIYRSAAWDVGQVLYFSAMQVSETLPLDP